MFTPVDKNLLIAAMESAIYHACVNANVVSLHAIETGVSALRQRFDQNPDSITDDDVFGMVDTIDRAKIPTISQISALNNETNIADRVVSFLWKNILDKPTTFPPAAHTHADLIADWNTLANKPTTFPPAVHTHADMIADWNMLANKPTTFPPAAHTHPEYAAGTGGGTTPTSAAPGSQWALQRGHTDILIYAQLPASIWTGARMRVMLTASLMDLRGEEDMPFLYVSEEGGSYLPMLSVYWTLDNEIRATAWEGASVIIPFGCPPSIEMIADVTATQITLTVNGATASATMTRCETDQLLSWQIFGMEKFVRCGLWTGDPATTAPLIIADAEHIDNHILINQAARHIGAGQYDLTLDAPVVLYQ